MTDSSLKPAIILLATFNGELYIEEQLNSILNQSYSNWILLIRDDSSTDSTLEIIQTHYLHDNRIQLVNDNKGPSGSAHQNFSYLIEAGLKFDANLFFFCDQDDLWHPDKIKLQKQAIETMNTSEPCLVHHDLEVVDSRLKLISRSFFRFQGLNPTAASFTSLLCRNEITGCTICCNRALLEYAYPVPKQVIMHDWWLALICAATGNIKIIDFSLIQYRQHNGNSVGAKFLHRLNPFTNWHKAWQNGNLRLLSSLSQALVLQEHFTKKNLNDRLPLNSSQSLQFYIHILETPKMQRYSHSKSFGLIKSYWLLNILYRIRLLIL